MAVNLSPVGGVAAQFFDNDGNVLSGGKIYTYAAGSSTPQATYTTGAGNIAHANPIILDSAGRVPTGEIWLTDGVAYKIVIKDANDTLIGTYDNIVGINSNFINFLAEQEIQTATAGQTVFTLTTTSYQPGTNTLSVYVDGVNQYGPGAQYAYTETSSTVVTFNSGLHVGAEVKFTTTQTLSGGAVDSSQVVYDPPFTGSVATNVEAKLAQTVSVMDFGAVGDGVTDDTAAIQAALDWQGATQQSAVPSTGIYVGTTVAIHFPKGEYLISSTLSGVSDYAILTGEEAIIRQAPVFTGSAAFEMLGNAWRIYIDGLQFAGFQTGIHLDNNNQNSGMIVIRNCGFFDCSYRALWLDVSSSKTTIENCLWRSNRYDVYIQSGDLVSIVGGWISRKANMMVDNYDGCIINYSNRLVIRDLICVPSESETVTEPAWIKNFYSIDCTGVRFGGESGGLTAVNNFADASPFATQGDKYEVLIRNCDLYAGTGGKPAVRVFYVPNAIVVENNIGLTASGSYAIGWSSVVTAPEQAARLPADVSQSRWFWIHCRNNNGQDGIVDANLAAYATTNYQLRLFSSDTSGRNIVFDYLSDTIGIGDTYGSIEWKGYDSSDPTHVGIRAALIARSASVGGGVDLIFATGPDYGAVTENFAMQGNGSLRIGTSGSPFIQSGSGSPEGVVTAPVGSLFMRTNGGANTTLYVKESGSGNTGWVGK